MERDKDLKVDVNALDDDIRCEYCIYHYDCQKNIEYHNGEMFEPYCTSHEPDDWFDTEEYLKNLEESEEWRPIKGYEGKYEVSNYGRVKCVSNIHYSQVGKILKPWEGNKKYLYITLIKDRKKKTCAVHRLVLEAFVGERPIGKQCAHWDGNPHNNHVSNLRWATAKENCADRDRHGRTAKGEKQGCSVLDEKAVKSIMKLKDSGMSKYEVGHLACVSYTTIERIWNGESWRDIVNG